MSESSSPAFRTPSTSSNEERWLFDLGVHPSLMDLLMEKRKHVGPEVVHDSRYDSILTPFELIWNFGYGTNVAALSMTTDERTEIFYTSVNVGVIYDYCKKQMFHLTGHQTRIVCATMDASGRWLVTADNGKDNVLIFWDTTEKKLIYTIFNHPKAPQKMIKMSLSPSAKVLITVTNEDSMKIHFWFWTFGRDKPDYTYVCENEDAFGEPRSVDYHPNKEQHFMVVFEKCVMFFQWDENDGVTAEPSIPIIDRPSVFGSFTDGTYVEHCHECYVSTTKGYLVVFGTTIYIRPFQTEEDLDNNKLFIKAIKVSSHPITVVTSSGRFILTGDNTGRIFFFDSTLRLVYWLAKSLERGIFNISFKRRRNQKYEYVEEFQTDDDDRSGVMRECEDRTVEYEKILTTKVPRSASLGHSFLNVKDFFVSTVDGSLYNINFLRNECVPIFAPCEGYITCIDINDELPQILLAYSKGTLKVVNYLTKEEIISQKAPYSDEVMGSNEAMITSVKFSKSCYHLACGKSNGEVWILHPALLTSIYHQPFRYGDEPILGMTFNSKGLQMACYDSGNTVFGFCYDTNEETWMFKGKVRPHYKEICNMFFLDEPLEGLYSLGKDRNLIRYGNLQDCEDNLVILNRERIEQRATPVYFIHYVKKKLSKSAYFLVADNEFKYKIVTTTTNMCTAVYLGPSYGCFSDNYVNKMEFVPSTNKKFLVFMNKKHIGLQLLPIDGNPYRYVGMLGHPEELLDFRLSYDGKYLFTVGRKDRVLSMWKIHFMSVEVMYLMGGEELQPFYCLIEGGRSGFIFQEMRDLFYYMQILQQGEKVPVPRIVTNSINLAELPDLVRACGYYPTEYEIENLLTDMRYKDFDDTGLVKDKATFCEFVKLYINHRPAHGYSIERLEEAFDTITGYDEENYEGEIERQLFIEAIMSSGENVNREQLFKCLITLMHYDLPSNVIEEVGGEKDFSFLPDTITFDTFMEEILGVDLSRVQSVPKADDEEDGSGGSLYRAMYGRDD